MKNFRIWLVILLALLLPVRAAVAAGMLCEHAAASGGARQSQAFAAGHGHMLGSAGHHGEAGRGLAGHDKAVAGVAHATASDAASDAAPSAEACGICTSCCSATAMASSLPAVPSPQAFNPLAFPCAATAAPSFITGGLDRPPRSI